MSKRTGNRNGRVAKKRSARIRRRLSRTWHARNYYIPIPGTHLFEVRQRPALIVFDEVAAINFRAYIDAEAAKIFSSVGIPARH